MQTAPCESEFMKIVCECRRTEDTDDHMFDLLLYVKPSRDAWKKQCHRARHFNRLLTSQSTREPETLAAAGTNIRLLPKERRPRVFERHPCWVNKREYKIVMLTRKNTSLIRVEIFKRDSSSFCNTLLWIFSHKSWNTGCFCDQCIQTSKLSGSARKHNAFVHHIS